MAFYETHLGYVGLGSTVVFRTAEQAAKDLETFSAETGELDTHVKKQGGLLAQQEIYTYAASRGRLKDIDESITNIEKDVDKLKLQVDAKVTELESLGVPNVGAMIGQTAQMIATFWIPGLAALQFLGIDLFGGKKNERKRRAKKLMEELMELKKEIEWRLSHRQQLIDEGKNLSAVMEHGSSKDVSVSLVAIPKKEETVKTVYDSARQTMHKITRIVDVKDPYVMTAAEGAKRAEISYVGAKLPEGVQKIYSPALRDKSILVQTAKPADAPKLITGHKLVFGGLAGPENVYTQPSTLFMWLTLSATAWFAYTLATTPDPLPVRRRMPMVRPWMV